MSTVTDGVSKLNWKNYANVAAYVANVVVTYTSITGLYGETNTVLSKRYQTLVTPAGWAFAIWGPIFIWEGIFTVAQMLPRYRNLDSVQKTSPWWWATCAFQVSWSLFFAQEMITAALVCMLGILFSLLGALAFGDSVRGTTSEYWLIKAPFSLHAGWLIAASAVNLSVEFDSQKAEPSTLLAVAIFSFALVFMAIAGAAIGVDVPKPVTCFVGWWAFTAIASELYEAKLLNDPDRFNPYKWDRVVLDGLRSAALFLSYASLALTIVAGMLRVFPQLQAKKAETCQAEPLRESELSISVSENSATGVI
eukprot:TRINITY_DN66111_c0_g1_i1.p1 TRINITY_DN66111_c0_g1~~TRINITY_DN66111_c0_g1_i1.p1  ORF type:complete len:308 (+),score=55.42 TRINITY_DN66111_c0_g1_i1:98-1021(+)